jgi:hypothetical protein
MARPVIVAVDGDPPVLSADSGEKALDILGKLELRGAPSPSTPDGRDTLRRSPAGREKNHRRRIGSDEG